MNIVLRSPTVAAFWVRYRFFIIAALLVVVFVNFVGVSIKMERLTRYTLADGVYYEKYYCTFGVVTTFRRIPILDFYDNKIRCISVVLLPSEARLLGEIR